MKVTGFLAFAILSVSILSYGMTGASADTHLPLTVKTDLPLYSDGSIITITGKIRNYDSNSTLNEPVTIQVVSGTNRVAIAQVTPNNDGTFQTTLKAGGPVWKAGGEHTVMVNYKTSKVETMFDYAGGVSAPIEPPPIVAPAPPPPPPPIECESGYDLVNGECVQQAPTPPPAPVKEPEPDCGPGTIFDPNTNTCIVDTKDPPPKTGGGCLIATATYGTELAPQVQMLRELRDNTVMSTGSGESFMTVFNDVYYSFSPYVADLEREHPAFREAVKAFITPMISSLAIMSLAENGSESHVLGLGITVIALNLGMYVAAPALIGFKVHRHIKSKMS